MSLLFDYQIDALNRMKNGCILCGGVGSGKSRTALAYYYTQNGGSIEPFEPMDDTNVMDLYIITTARKRDKKEWEVDMAPFMLSTHEDINIGSQKVYVDSWNNIKKYKDVKNAFFIFDEQRVVGRGTWVQSFLEIAKNNKWILLSATPGDSWSDYIPVFIANGFYRNFTHFKDEHIVYDRFVSYPKISKYLNTGMLIKYRNDILVDMDFRRKTVRNNIDVVVPFDTASYKTVYRDRWYPYKDKPIETAAELCYTLRKIVNSDESRVVKVLEIFEERGKVIIFYNFDYELDILKNIYFGEDVQVAEWNGHKHEDIPDSKRWVYLVQYTAGAEGWNCILTDTIIFFSQTYSYKILEQSQGRIDRLNTPYTNLYYYHIRSGSSIDIQIKRALKAKKDFNYRSFVTW